MCCRKIQAGRREIRRYRKAKANSPWTLYCCSDRGAFDCRLSTMLARLCHRIVFSLVLLSTIPARVSLENEPGPTTRISRFVWGWLLEIVAWAFIVLAFIFLITLLVLRSSGEDVWGADILIMCQSIILSHIGLGVRAVITGSDLAVDYLVHTILGKAFLDLSPYIYDASSLFTLMFIGCEWLCCYSGCMEKVKQWMQRWQIGRQ